MTDQWTEKFKIKDVQSKVQVAIANTTDDALQLYFDQNTSTVQSSWKTSDPNAELRTNLICVCYKVGIHLLCSKSGGKYSIGHAYWFACDRIQQFLNKFFLKNLQFFILVL